MRGPRVFFGTMYSGEAEFEECCNAISSQKFLDSYTHHVINGKSEKDAHNELWDAWERAKPEFDLFVKVDADTIIGSPEAISQVWQLFAENPRVTGAQLRLHDFFTDDLIFGLNFFSPVVKFDKSPDLYCDRVDSNHDIIVRGASVKHLEPIGLHCKNPNDAQAFHFGLHRMLKGQTPTLRKVWQKYTETGDRARELALLGAAAALFDRQSFVGDKNSYDSDTFKGALNIATSVMTREQTLETIERLHRTVGWSCEF